MVDFDVGKAAEITVSGVVAAFLAILFLIVLTRLSRLAGRLRSKPNVLPPGSPAEAQSEGSVQASAGHNAQLVSAIAVAVAIGLEEEESLTVEAGAQVKPGSQTVAGGWKSYGRWQAVEPRGTWRRGGR